jgi:peptide/nickel transport system permease protein
MSRPSTSPISWAAWWSWKIFGYPGFGSLLVDARQLRDLPLIEATIMIAAAVYIAANLMADVGAILLNPRLKQG